MTQIVEKTFVTSLTKWIAPVLVLPFGSSLGMQFGLLSDYGLQFTVRNIQLNSESFARQYAHPLVWQGWLSIAIALYIVLVVGTLAFRRARPKA